VRLRQQELNQGGGKTQASPRGARAQVSAIGPLEDGFDAGHQRAGLDRLVQVVLGAQVERFLLGVPGLAGEQPRHFDVQHHQIDAALLDPRP